jgi:hypothetical protein
MVILRNGDGCGLPIHVAALAAAAAAADGTLGIAAGNLI